MRLLFQSLESPRTPEDSSRVELKSVQVTSLLERVQTICEEDIDDLSAQVEEWSQLEADKAFSQQWTE